MYMYIHVAIMAHTKFVHRAFLCRISITGRSPLYKPHIIGLLVIIHMEVIIRSGIVCSGGGVRKNAGIFVSVVVMILCTHPAAVTT